MHSERLLLREMKETDWPHVHAYASQERVCQFQPWGPNTEQDTREYLREVLEDAAKQPRKRYVFAIIHKETTSLIGAVELSIKSFPDSEGEIGYIIHPDHWGKGVAAEASRLVMGFGFEKLKLHRISATCSPDNVSSARVLEKLGMVREGRIQQHLRLKEGWRDSLLYSALECEWPG
ncbi:GNAT family N-acetyltransferase [Peribacillus sp. SCS-37]|uniref:GNAT family N-acetyltransferase n=1 Tax=Paraperibacillus esterisolvens TaxID=3115296 RepID=UPI003906040D